MLNGQDFKEMFFRIDSEKNLKKAPNVNLVPDLLKLKEHQARYLIYLYDAGSPFTKKFQDLDQRKEAIRDYVGLPKTKQADMEDVDNVIDIITAMLKVQANRLWTQIVCTEQMFYENVKRLLEESESDKDKDVLQALKIKNEIRKIQQEIVNDLEVMWKSFAGDHEEVKTRIAASVRYSPETIANVS